MMQKSADYHLKACPFCGGKADWFVLEKMNNEKLYYVECSYCFARTGYYFTEYESIKEWNKRTPDWISVNKRLPEESGDYLVFVEGLIEPFKEDCSELYQRLQETQSKIKEELIQLAGVREEIRQVILTIPDEEIRNIFLRKYLAYETNEQIADAMFYDLRTVQRKHKKWLDRLVLPNVQEEEKTPF